jgi:membrane protein YqaA with SNARE-associated domain
MIRTLYNETMSLAGHKNARWALASVSFAESSFFPLPPDVLLIPMVLENRRNAWQYALICTIASVLGAFLGYAIGMFFFELAGRPLIEFYGKVEQFEHLKEMFAQNSWWIVFTAGLTPFPFKVITITSGLFGLNPLIFFAGCVISRGMRFYLVAALLWKFGTPIKIFIEKYLGWLTILFCLLLVGGYFVVKLLL